MRDSWTKTSLDFIVVLAPAAAILLLADACSSSTTPSPTNGSEGGVGTAEAGPDAGACVQDKKRVAKDDAGICCPGLFKACVGGASEGVSPCICSTVQCGTAAMQPPPNVPCCTVPVMSSSCNTPLGNGGPNMTGDTQCKCGQ